MKPETIGMAIGLIDDDMIEETDTLRNRKHKIHWKRWTALAACLCLVAGAATIFFQGFPILGGKCGGNPGILVDGNYYYRTDFSFYRYTPEKKEWLVSTFNREDEWQADEYGLYFSKGRNLYVREHESGKTRLLFAAGRDICDRVLIKGLRDNQIILWLVKHNANTEDVDMIRLDGKNGEIIWKGTVTWDELLVISAMGNQGLPAGTGVTDFPVGDDVFSLALVNEKYELYRNGEPFLPGKYEYQLSYYGENLLIRYQPEATRSACVYLLVKTDGEIVELPKGWYLAGTDDLLLFVDNVWLSTPYDLYGYDVKTGESTLLLTDADVYYLETDGTWLYSNTPWGGRTDCWKLEYDETGKLTGLTLWAEDI